MFIFYCTTSPPKNAKVIGVRIFLPYIRYVATTIPCESVRHKSNTFHTILALCTCLYRSHLKPVSMKQTKHSRKSEAQNLCSKCPPFTRTHAFKWLRHCAITAVMMVWSSSLHLLLHIMDPETVDPLLKYTPDAVVHRIQSGELGGHVSIGIKSGVSLCSMVTVSRARWMTWFQWCQHYVTR